MFKNYRVLVLGDREFRSPKLAQWLSQRGVSFALRQKQDCYFQEAQQETDRVLKDLGFKPGMSNFYQGIRCIASVRLIWQWIGSENIAMQGQKNRGTF